VVIEKGFGNDMKVGDRVRLTKQYKRFACSVARGDCHTRYLNTQWWYEQLLTHKEDIGKLVEVDRNGVVRVQWANDQRAWICLKDLVVV